MPMSGQSLALAHHHTNGKLVSDLWKRVQAFMNPIVPTRH
jgi:hypothetical protein